MKSPWFWIIAGAISLYIFSDEKKNQVPEPRRGQFQPLPQTLPPSASMAYTPPVRTPTTFMGYQCTDDCSGHEAGYQWAEEHDIDDPDDCDGNSESFIEGCQAYAKEQQ